MEEYQPRNNTVKAYVPVHVARAVRGFLPAVLKQASSNFSLRRQRQIMKSRLLKAGLTLGFAAAFTVPMFAQQTSSSAQDGNAALQTQGQERFKGKGRRHHRRGNRHMMMGAMQKLNLSDAQRTQMRAIAERNAGSTKALREELRNLRVQSKQGGTLTSEQQARLETLRTELRSAKKSSHAEMVNVLTPEQRTQLEALKAEAKARRQQRQGDNQGNN
jgi:Spy/CpxP family protein refolding chaperone